VSVHLFALEWGYAKGFRAIFMNLVGLGATVGRTH